MIRILMTLITVLPIAAQAQAQAPITLTYQGSLADIGGEPVPDGDRQVAFNLYTQREGGDPVWTEQHAVAVLDSSFEQVLGERI